MIGIGINIEEIIKQNKSLEEVFNKCLERYSCKENIVFNAKLQFNLIYDILKYCIYNSDFNQESKDFIFRYVQILLNNWSDEIRKFELENL